MRTRPRTRGLADSARLAPCILCSEPRQNGRATDSTARPAVQQRGTGGVKKGKAGASAVSGAPDGNGPLWPLARWGIKLKRGCLLFPSPVATTDTTVRDNGHNFLLQILRRDFRLGPRFWREMLRCAALRGTCLLLQSSQRVLARSPSCSFRRGTAHGRGKWGHCAWSRQHGFCKVVLQNGCVFLPLYSMVMVIFRTCPRSVHLLVHRLMALISTSMTSLQLLYEFTDDYSPSVMLPHG